MKKLAYKLGLSIACNLPLISIDCGIDSTKQFTFKDMTDEDITINKPTKIAVPSRAAFDMLVAFGLGEKIDGVYKNA